MSLTHKPVISKDIVTLAVPMALLPNMNELVNVAANFLVTRRLLVNAIQE